MTGIVDLRARQAAAGLMKASRAILERVVFDAVGTRDPSVHMNWPDMELYRAYVALAAAIGAGDAHDLGFAPFRFETCKACRHFMPHATGAAESAPQEVAGEITHGFCAAHPPIPMASTNGHASRSIWPPVHGDQVCGEYHNLSNRKLYP